MSGAQTQDEILVKMGKVLFWNTCQDSVGCVFYGIYLVLFSYCLRVTLLRPVNTRASKVLLAAILALFISTTGQFILDMISILQQISTYLIRSNVPLEDRRSQYTNQFVNVKIVAAWPVLVNFMISDLIVVWRAWVLYPHNLIVRAILAIVTTTDAVLWVYAQALVSKHSKEFNSPTSDQQLSTASNFISLGTNLLGTGFIAAQAWRLRSLTGGRSSFKGSRSEVTRVLFVLVETGAIFAVIQLVNSILGEVDLVSLSQLDLATDVWGKSAIYLAAILPTLTIIIIRANRSVETWSLNVMTDTGTPAATSTKMTTIQFGGARMMSSASESGIYSENGEAAGDGEAGRDGRSQKDQTSVV